MTSGKRNVLVNSISHVHLIDFVIGTSALTQRKKRELLFEGERLEFSTVTYTVLVIQVIPTRYYIYTSMAHLDTFVQSRFREPGVYSTCC